LDVQNLKQALKRLTEEQQQVILLRFVEGMSHAEVGAIIGKSEGAVRSIQYRALLALGEILKPSAPS
jgi:RNA polymerase sigma-70 factor (ECF subfamily)